jgi:hypothetical protein
MASVAPTAMADIDCDAFDAESIEELFEPTVEVPAALLLAAGCCCGTAGGAARSGWLGHRCC